MDGFAPVGPLVTDEVDPSALELETRLNGTVVQSGNTSQFMTRIPELLAFITASMTLEPGDVAVGLQNGTIDGAATSYRALCSARCVPDRTHRALVCLPNGEKGWKYPAPCVNILLYVQSGPYA